MTFLTTLRRDTGQYYVLKLTFDSHYCGLEECLQVCIVSQHFKVYLTFYIVYKVTLRKTVPPSLRNLGDIVSGPYDMDVYKQLSWIFFGGVKDLKKFCMKNHF